MDFRVEFYIVWNLSDKIYNNLLCEEAKMNTALLGSLLAIVFAVSMISLLWWMLHPPKPLSPMVAKAVRSVDALKRILVPALEMPYSERAVELACRLGGEQKAELILVYVIEVPRTLPLDASLPEADMQAKEALKEAEEIAVRHGFKPELRIGRAREAGDKIIRVAKDLDVDVIVMGIRPVVGPAEELFGRTTDYLLRRPPCEVIIDKLAEGTYI